MPKSWRFVLAAVGLNNKQYIVVATSGGASSGEYVAYRLP